MRSRLRHAGAKNLDPVEVQVLLLIEIDLQ